MSELALWVAYIEARTAFAEEPSPLTEAACIAAFAEFAREFAPAAADRAITEYCGAIAGLSEATQ